MDVSSIFELNTIAGKNYSVIKFARILDELQIMRPSLDYLRGLTLNMRY